MSEKPEYIKKLEQSECECVPCPSCKGKGTVYWINGKYYGPDHPCDDLADLEVCEVCSNGIAETCDRCAQLESYEFEILDYYVEHGA